MTPSKLRWGLLFIVIGAMILLCNTGRLDWGYWGDLLMWWPVLLIAIGIEKIFLKTRLEFISYLSPLILIAAMIFVAFNTGSGKELGSFFSRSHWSEPYETTIDHIDAVIKNENIDLYVTRTSTDLISADFGRFLRKPHVDFSNADGIANLEIAKRHGGMAGAIVISGTRYDNDWKVSFSDKTPLSLKCLGDGSNIKLNLSSVPLQDLTIEDADGDIDLRIGDKSPHVAILVDGADSDLRLKVPAGCGIQIVGDQFESYFSDLGFIKIDRNYYSKAYDSAAVKVTLEIPENLNRLKIDFE